MAQKWEEHRYRTSSQQKKENIKNNLWGAFKYYMYTKIRFT